MVIPPSPAAALAQLTHSRWALPILAHVGQSGGCKLVTLSRRLGASPTSLRRALDRLEALDLVIRNPGYGHPLRPEYILGSLGERTADLSSAIVEWEQHIDQAGQLFKKWQLPVLVALEPDTRFGQVRHQVPMATARAVTLALKFHASAGLLRRDVQNGYPPVPLYTPTPLAQAGREPSRLLGELLAEGHSSAAAASR